MAIMSIKNVNKKFHIKGHNYVCAVNGVDLNFDEGETLGLVGESGCGKSTIGRMIVRLTEPTSGQIIYDDQDIFKKSKKEATVLYREIQMVFQDPYGALNPRKHVRSIIEEPLIINKIGSEDTRIERVLQMLEMVELDETFLNKYPIELTQGEQQRIGVARAFVTNPRVIVLDEPTSLLDIRFRGEIVLLLQKLQKENNCAYLFISHDLNVVYQLSHKVAVMYLGRIVEQGDVDVLFNDPKHPYTKALLNATLFPDPDQDRGGFKLTGEVPSPVNLSDKQCNFAARCPNATERCRRELPKLEDSGDRHLACYNIK